uniref:DUF935 family protein n=1 Tax=Anaerolinea thermolimosa TaxID=229919 RepID=A0A7C4PML3_9CHLR
MFSVMDQAFMNSLLSQKNASFPSYEYDGPFSRLAQHIQVQQYQRIKRCLGREWFYHHDSPLIRATRGLVFLKEMQPEEFYLLKEEGGETAGDADPTGGGFAEGQPDHQDLLDQLVEAMLPEAAKRNAAFVDQLLGLIQRAESYQDIQLLLAEHLGREMGQDQQEDLLADLLTAAQLMGRAAVRDEADA